MTKISDNKHGNHEVCAPKGFLGGIWHEKGRWRYHKRQCKALAQTVKEIIDTKSSYADWLNNQNVRNQPKLDIKICLIKNAYPPQCSSEVFRKVMEQVENFEENN